jgi:hypothetical protein
MATYVYFFYIGIWGDFFFLTNNSFLVYSTHPKASSYQRKASGVEGTEVSGASSAEGMQKQETDGSRGSGESDAFSNSESSGACFWGAGKACGKSDRTGYWYGQGKGQDWLEESGLQFGSILCIGGDMRVPGASTGQNNPAGSLKGDPIGIPNRHC